MKTHHSLETNSNGKNNISAITPQFDDSVFIQPDELRAHVNQLIVNNGFPVEVFPEAIQAIIKATNENLNFPIDFIGASILYAGSVAIGNAYKVEVKRGWVESAVLYLAIVARAGTNKSHPLSFALQPIIDQDKKTYRVFEQQRQEFERTATLTKKEREDQQVDEPVKPVWQKFLVSDFTPEALAQVLKFNLRGIGVYADEFAGWFKNFNRYNKGSEMEFWLSIWSGKPISIDRKTGDPVFIPLPFISVAGTIQNGILNELAKDSRTQNGFIDRILFVIPDNIQKPYWSETEIDPVIIDSWQSIVSNLMNLPIHLDETLCPEPEVLRFTPEAKRMLFDWQKSNADQCNDAENEAISGIYSKLEMYAVRLALILEMMRFACNESDKQAVSVEAMQGALKLVEYFKNSAVKVHSIISNASPLDKLPTDKRKFYEELPGKFTTAEGLAIAELHDIPADTFHKWLRRERKVLFEKIKTGEYEKLI